MNTSWINRSPRYLTGAVCVASLCLLTGTVQAQETTYLLDFNSATGAPEGGVDVVAVSESSATGSVESQDPGLPGVSAWFQTHAYPIAGYNAWGRVTSLLLDTAMDSGASGQSGDHAASLTVGSHSAAYYANVIVSADGWQLDPENPLDAVVSVDLKAGLEDAVCVRVETGEDATLGSRRQYLMGTGEWQTLTFTLRDGKTWSAHNNRDVATGLPLRIVVQFEDARPGMLFVDNVRLEHVQHASE